MLQSYVYDSQQNHHSPTSTTPFNYMFMGGAALHKITDNNLSKKNIIVKCCD